MVNYLINYLDSVVFYNFGSKTVKLKCFTNLLRDSPNLNIIDCKIEAKGVTPMPVAINTA